MDECRSPKPDDEGSTPFGSVAGVVHRKNACLISRRLWVRLPPPAPREGLDECRSPKPDDDGSTPIQTVRLEGCYQGVSETEEMVFLEVAASKMAEVSRQRRPTGRVIGLRLRVLKVRVLPLASRARGSLGQSVVRQPQTRDSCSGMAR